MITISDSETPGALTVTASSSIQGVLPNTNLAVSDSRFFRGVAFSPLPNQHGNTTVTLTVSDGFLTNQAVFGITVMPVNDAPTAANDSYAVNATQLLTMPAGSGLLANDADIDGPSLTAALVQGPANGALTLQPDGSFTYQPTGTSTGTDSFTYRATDGSANSNVATVTIKVNPLPCAPRPRVQTSLAADGGKLLVTVTSSPITEQQPATLRTLQFGELKNARVVVSGQTMANGQHFIVPVNATIVEFTVERVTRGQPTTVPLTVVDDCGAWPTFVGGGTATGF